MIFLPGEPLALERLLSQPRLDRYKIFATGNTREGRLHAYRWNAEISASLQIDVGILEVAVRNAMNQELAKLFGRKHWYLAADHVSYIPELDDRAVGSLRMAKRWLGNTDELYEWSAGKVIAELTFAFWVGLLDKGGPRKGGVRADYRTTIWLPPGGQLTGVRHAFKHLPQPSRRKLHGKLAILVELRNRIAHYEPIFDGIRVPGTTRTTPTIPLTDVYNTLLEVAGYISPDLLFWIRSTSQTPQLLERRPT